MSRVCFDANVLLETVLVRSGKKVADQVLHAAAGEASVSALTGHLLFHFGRRERPLEQLQVFLDEFEILALQADDFAWAYHNVRNSDFEDALQVSVALRTGCEVFYTFDRNLYAAYKHLPNLTIKLLA